MLQRCCLLLAGLSSSLLLAGCSGDGAEGGERIPVHPVKGKVTMAGSPVPGAMVTFSPVDSTKTRVAFGTTNDNGEYALTTYENNDGAGAGDYVVVVTKNSGSSSGVPTPEEAHAQAMKGGAAAGHGSGGSNDAGSSLPKKYSDPKTSDLKATVKEGDNSFDFPLKP